MPPVRYQLLQTWGSLGVWGHTQDFLWERSDDLVLDPRLLEIGREIAHSVSGDASEAVLALEQKRREDHVAQILSKHHGLDIRLVERHILHPGVKLHVQCVSAFILLALFGDPGQHHGTEGLVLVAFEVEE